MSRRRNPHRTKLERRPDAYREGRAASEDGVALGANPYPRGTPDHRLPLGDVDAPVKAVLDVLEAGGVVGDDVQVVRIVAEKHLDRDYPRIEIQLWPATVTP